MSKYKETRDEEIASAQRTARDTRVMACDTSSITKSPSTTQSSRSSGTSASIGSTSSPSVQYPPFIPPTHFSTGYNTELAIRSFATNPEILPSIREYLNSTSWKEAAIIVATHTMPFPVTLYVSALSEVEKKITSINWRMDQVWGKVPTIDGKLMGPENEQKLADENKKMAEEVKKLSDEMKILRGMESRLSKLEDERKRDRRDKGEVDSEEVDVEKNRMREEIERLKEEIKKRDLERDRRGREEK